MGAIIRRLCKSQAIYAISCFMSHEIRPFFATFGLGLKRLVRILRSSDGVETRFVVDCVRWVETPGSLRLRFPGIAARLKPRPFNAAFARSTRRGCDCF